MGYLDRLNEIVGPDNVLTSQADCLGYARDMSIHHGVPEAVVFVESTDQIAAIMKLANREKFPVVTRGGGTSVTGAVLASKGGVLLNLVRMNKIKDINLADGYVVVDPGVICNQLNAAVSPTHFYPPDPGSAPIATIGGMVATNASGVRAVKYGTARDYVMAMEVVLADGEVIRVGGKAVKTSAGYDLPRLFSTSEGTLGIITELTVKILPAPEYSAYAKLSFPTIVEAGAAVEEILTRGLPISTCEVLDGVSIDVVKKAMGLEVPDNVTCLLFMEVDGAKAAVTGQIDKINAICKEKGGLDQEWNDDPAKRAEIWSARQGLVPALSRVKPGYRQMTLVEDFGVPMTKIPATIAEIQAVGEKHGVQIATFGHIGDGNLHAVVLFDPRKPEEWDTAKKIAEDFIDLTLKYEGTLTAEHGVGMAKSPYIGRELGGGAKVMAAIKKALDPNDVLNPGKMGFEGSIKDIYAERSFEKIIGGIDPALSYGDYVDNEIMACIQCGFCTLGCPTYATQQIETMNARGRVNLAYYLLSGAVEPSQEIADRLNQCTMCLNCKAVCPAQVNVSDIVQAARAKIYQSGIKPEAFLLAYKSMIENGNPFLEPKDKRNDIVPKPTVKPAEAEVVYWAGCVSSYQDLKIGPAAVKILDAAGVKWSSLAEEEGCCGYLAYASGAMDVFDQSRQANLESFAANGVKKLVASCAGCFKTFKELYPKFGEVGYQPYHFLEFVSELIADGRLKLTGKGKTIKAAYHDPCDIGRHMGIYEPPRQLLNALPDVELIEFAQNRNLAKCCGGGGAMKGFDLDLSLELAEKRVLQAIDVGAEAIVSACPSCKQNLNQAAARLKKEGKTKKKIKVFDILELVSKNLG